MNSITIQLDSAQRNGPVADSGRRTCRDYYYCGGSAVRAAVAIAEISTALRPNDGPGVFLLNCNPLCASKSTTPRSATAARAKGSTFRSDKLDITATRPAWASILRRGGLSASNEKDAQYFSIARSARLEPETNARSVAFWNDAASQGGRAAAEDPGMHALLDSGAETITLVGKTSDFHATAGATQFRWKKIWR